MARIIVVEDDLAQQEELVSYLAYMGHEVKGVESGVALDLCLQQFIPEIILLDYNLPGENGSALAERLREQFGLTIGIVMVTARGRAEDRIEYRRAGADDYLVKPRMENLVEGRRAGADDHLVKPVDFQEILSIIDNLLLRIQPSAELGEVWTLRRTRAELQPPSGPPIPLVASEVAILAALAAQEHHKATRDTLVRALDKDPFTYDTRALEAGISRLRRKLPPMPDGRNPLQAMRGSGYQFLRTLVVAQ